MPMSFGILPAGIPPNRCHAAGRYRHEHMVEEGDILFYLSRSGTFDENNCQLKQGRFRLRLSPNPFEDAKDFRQELKLIDGYVEISAEGTQVQLWQMFFIRLYT